MRYIDKYQLHAEAHALNVRFLEDCYAADRSHPLPSPADTKRSFDDFKKSVYREGPRGWKTLLLREQTAEGAPRCCYCMRRLNESAGLINFEHVIPRMLQGEEGQKQYSYYSHYAPALKDFVVLADEFCRKPMRSAADIEQAVQMPHTTALANLLAACNGVRDSQLSKGCCCNGARGDSLLMPIMLMPEAAEMIQYDANGLVMWVNPKDDTWRTTLQALNGDTLMEIRSVWYHLSRVRKDLSSALSMPLLERIEWFKAAYRTDNFAALPPSVKKYVGLILPDEPRSATSVAEKDWLWKQLMAYDWFYDYPGYACQREARE